MIERVQAAMFYVGYLKVIGIYYKFFVPEITESIDYIPLFVF